MTAQLPPGWTIDESEETKLQNKLPEGWSVSEEPPKPNPFQDVVSEELRAQGIEPDFGEELERAGELGVAEAMRGLFSGATFGLSEKVPGLETGDNLAAKGGEFIGSTLPLSGLIKVFSGPATKLAAKSPVFQRQLGSLANMFFAGASTSGIESLVEGEMPSTNDVLEHGFEWAALDAVLQSVGGIGKFATSLFRRSKLTGIPRKQIVNEVTEAIDAAGIDMAQPELVTAKALEVLEAPLTEAEQFAASQRKLQLAKAEESKAAQVAQEAIEPAQVTPKELKTRKIKDEPINRLTSETRILAEPYQPEKINFTKEAETLEKDALQAQIDSVGTKAATEEELGTAIREDIESQLETRKEEYRPLYRQAEEAAETKAHIPQNTAREAGNKLKRISRLSTKPEGYQSVIRTLENVLEDAGFAIQRSEQGIIEDIVSTKEVPISDTIELARRINEIIDYEAVEPTVKDALRSVVRAAKQDVREGLAEIPNALTAFNLAEEAHARTAQKYAKDSIRSIRGKEAGEKIAKMAESPSTLGDLRETLSPDQMLQVEREMLEKLNAKNYEQSKKMFNQLERHLSAENRKLAKDIVEAKNPHNPTARKRITQDAILNDMSNAFTNGSRPEKTLDLWKTPKGQKLVKETFHNSPNWPTVKNYLEKQSFNDMVSSVIKDGKLDLKKFKSFMRDPATLNNIRAQGGEEAVTFFNKLDNQVKQLDKNLQLLERLPTKKDVERGKEILRRSKEKATAKPKETKVAEESLAQQRRIAKETEGLRGSRILKRMVEKDFPIQAKAKKLSQWFTETMGLNEKGILSVFGLMKLGVPNTVASLIGYKTLNKMMTNPRVRRAFREATKHYTDPILFMTAFEEFANEVED